MIGPRLKVLGTLEYRDRRGRLVDLPLRKARALLAYLAISSDQRHSRDKLASLLWGEHGETQARRNLTQALSSLRRALIEDADAVLNADPQGVRINTAQLHLDLEQLRSLGRAEGDGAVESAVTEALVLCQGGLLDDLVLKEPAFEDWLTRERSAVRHTQTTLLEKLGERSLAQRDPASAVRAAERMVALEPLNEAAQRLLMRALAAAGRRTTALTQFQACRDLLRQELQVEPDAKTSALFESLKAQADEDVARDHDIPVEPLPERAKPAIAVLALTNLSGDPAQEFFCDGLSEDIITELSRFRSLSVIARHSSFSFKGRSVTAQQIGRELAVDYVLEGSIRRSGEALRINAQLIDSKSGHHLWAERYDRTLAEIDQLQDELVQKIVATLWQRLEGIGRERVRRRDRADMTAYELMMRGRELYLHFTKEDNIKARRDFERALELEPELTWAMTQLSWTYLFDGMCSWQEDTELALRKGLEFAHQAIVLDGSDATARTALACALLFTRHFDRAAAEFEKAVALNPNDPETLVLVGYFHNCLGRPDEALKWIEKALRFNPFAPNWYHWQLAINRYLARDYRDAATVLSKMEPTPIEVLGLLAASYARLGDSAGATDALARFHAFAKVRMVRYPADDGAAWLVYWSNGFPFKNPADLEHLLEGLRLAGLPLGKEAKCTQRSAKVQRAAQASAPLAASVTRPAIAVLAFANLSGDPDQEYIADGLSEDIITELSRFQSLSVVARQSSFAHKGKRVIAQQIGRDLGVDYIVEGSMARSGDQVRVTVQLVDAMNGHHLWAERYDQSMTDLFAVRDKVVQTIVSTITHRLEGFALAQARRKGTENLSAYEHLLRGRALYDRMTAEDDRLACREFEQAIELDPGYAAAYAQLARIYTDEFLFAWSLNPNQTLGRALSTARKAVELNQADSFTHAALAGIYLYMRQYGRAQKALDKAIALNPNNADVLLLKGFLLDSLGQPDEALEWIDTARRLNPVAPDWYIWELGRCHYLAQRYGEAASVLGDLETPPFEVHGLLAACHARLGQSESARSCLARFHEAARGQMARYPGTDPLAWRTYWSNGYPYRNESDLEHLLDGLRLAGLDV